MKYDVDETGSTAVRERAKHGSVKSDSEKQEVQKKMESVGEPGPQHKALEALVGNWKAEVKCWMEPGAEPKISQGTATATMALKGRFLEEEFQGEMMGQPFIGRTLMGYDNVKQTFNSVWISDMQTSMFTSEGKGDTGNKVITLEGKSTCPSTGQTDIPVRSVLRVISPDKHTFEMFNASKGENVKTMEITYTRK